MRFVNSVISEFTTAQANTTLAFRSYMEKIMFPVEIPYRLKNESSSKQLMKKFDKFTDNKFDVRIKWLKKKVKTVYS